MNLIGARPARFRRLRVLVVGCGDVGLRAAQVLGAGSQAPRVRLLALTSSASRRPELRARGIVPLTGNLDEPHSLRRLSGLAQRVLHLAPPPTSDSGDWRLDTRTRALVRALAQRSAPQAVVYGSTTGVYGDCQGARITEARPVAPATPRALRRVDAEDVLRQWGRAAGVGVSVLRIPGIYAPDRPGGTPRERLQRGTPALAPEDDVFTNHIHADDLARACVRALLRGRPQRAYHVSDDTDMKMGDYFDLAADLYGLPRPPRVSRENAQAQLPLQLLSFMGESRRLDNTRMKKELRLRLRHPTVAQGLMAKPTPRERPCSR